MVLIPTVKWAQRNHCLYVTIDVQDSKNPQIDLDNTEDGYGHLKYTAMATGGVEDQPYELDLVMYKAVDKDSSKISISPRNIFLMIEKKESETWPRLTKDTGRHLTHIKVDWDKWVDSDDEGDDKFDPSGMGEMGDISNFASMMKGMGGPGGGMGGMGGMGGLGGMGGMGGLDSMDFSAAGAGAAGGDADGAAADDDSDDEELPELEA